MDLILRLQRTFFFFQNLQSFSEDGIMVYGCGSLALVYKLWQDFVALPGHLPKHLFFLKKKKEKEKPKIYFHGPFDVIEIL